MPYRLATPLRAGLTLSMPNGRGSRIRTHECLSQSQVPYRLAIPLRKSANCANGVNSGARTHGLQGHNLALHQLSYIHHEISLHFFKSTQNGCFMCSMVHPERLEPPTFTLEGCCSIRLSYGCKTSYSSATSNTSHYPILAQKKNLVNTYLQSFLKFFVMLGI